MEVIAEFFVDSLVVPAYFYVAAYGFVWILAIVLSRVLLDPERSNVEKSARRAWRYALIMHLLGGTALIVWIVMRAMPRVAEWWHVPFYLIFYLLIVIVDIVVIAKSFERKTTKPATAASQTQRRIRNPKKN
ncbi:MAG: hypothetical protein OXC79_08275 [Candidatus Poribacteria bacterium]|nr:hypothetical protein [Candidatus Poribacteria bacterium]